MTPLELGALIAAATVVILIIGVPVAFALGAVSVTALVWFEGAAGLDSVADTFLRALENFNLAAVPFFVLMGVAAALSPAGNDFREMLKRWFHEIPGGLIAANVCASALFSALAPTGPATCLAVGREGLPELRARRYREGLVTGAVAAAGTLGMLIPPSLAMIVYGIEADLSIARLFLAGLLPGLMLAAMFTAWSMWAAKRWKGRYGAFARGYSRTEMLVLLPRVVPFLLIIAGLLYALWSGVARPSEAAAVAAVACVLCVAVVYGHWRPAALWRILREGTRESVAVLIIIAAAVLFAYTLQHFGVADAAATAVTDMALPGWQLLLAINVYLLIAGLFLPAIAVILMSVPILLPLVVGAGFDPYWFAVMMTMNLQIGLITPPVGLNLSTARALMPGVATGAVLRGALPFILLIGLALVLISLFPAIATWLPTFLMGPPA